MKPIISILFAAIMLHASANAVPLTDTLPIVLHTTTGEIFGTLTVPVSSKPIPVALIIAGSGPTDRNGNNPMMKNESLHLLANALSEKNIASLRFDKRGIAESKGAMKSEADLRFEDYINDATAWITLLKKTAVFRKLS